jgi:hypothetical protein
MYLTLKPTIGKSRTLPSQQKYNGTFFLISRKIKLGVIGICKLSSYTHTQNPSDMCDSDEIWECTKREEKEPYVFIESLIEKTLCDSSTYVLNNASPAVLLSMWPCKIIFHIQV